MDKAVRRGQTFECPKYSYSQVLGQHWQLPPLRWIFGALRLPPPQILSHIGTGGLRGEESKRGYGLTGNIRSACGIRVFGDLA